MQTEASYYIAHNGVESGPFTMAQVMAQVKAHTVTHGDYIWKEGFAEWLPIERICPGVTAAPENSQPRDPEEESSAAKAVSTVSEKLDSTVKQLRAKMKTPAVESVVTAARQATADAVSKVKQLRTEIKEGAERRAQNASPVVGAAPSAAPTQAPSSAPTPAAAPPSAVPAGYPANLGYPPNSGYPSNPGYPSNSGYPFNHGYPSNPGYPPNPGYPQYSGCPPYPTPVMPYPVPCSPYGYPMPRQYNIVNAFWGCMTQRFALSEGRASRSEYWYAHLGWCLLLLLLMVMVKFFIMYANADADVSFIVSSIVFALYMLVTFLALLGVQCRRLHDAGYSGWLILINFMPFFGNLIVMILSCLPSTQGPNKYGAYPLPPVA